MKAKFKLGQKVINVRKVRAEGRDLPEETFGIIESVHTFRGYEARYGVKFEPRPDYGQPKSRLLFVDEDNLVKV